MRGGLRGGWLARAALLCLALLARQQLVIARQDLSDAAPRLAPTAASQKWPRAGASPVRETFRHTDDLGASLLGIELPAVRGSGVEVMDSHSRDAPTAATIPRKGVLRGGATDGGKSSAAETARVLGYFGLWYVLNVWYNIQNKKVLNRLPLPWTVAAAQLGIGGVWVGLQWAFRLREHPGAGVLSGEGLRRVGRVAAFHGGGQLATVLSLGAGAVSFTHIVKAMEPFFAAMVAAVCFRQVFRPQVYATLVPVVAGVSLACYSEIHFKLLSFLAAMASNLLFALRSNFSKSVMTRPPEGKRLSAANLYGVVTVLAFALLAPLAVGVEGSRWGGVWRDALATGVPAVGMTASIVLSGLSHYLNNEVMYLALSSVHPTTLAVGNTMKRVFIIVASLVVFKTPISWLGALGSAIGIGGVLLYSLTKQHYDAMEAQAAAAHGK